MITSANLGYFITASGIVAAAIVTGLFVRLGRRTREALTWQQMFDRLDAQDTKLEGMRKSLVAVQDEATTFRSGFRAFHQYHARWADAPPFTREEQTAIESAEKVLDNPAEPDEKDET